MLLALALGACTDVLPTDGRTVASADLVVLPQDPAAPPPASAAFWVPNGRTVTHSLYHPDPQSNLYARLTFPAGSLVSLDGTPLGTSDSVLVTVTPRAGGYGITLSPSGLALSERAAPSVLFAFGRYGDPDAAAGAYPDRDAFLAALEVWEEVGFDRWGVAAGSGPAGVDEVRGIIGAPGRLWLAAERP